MTDRSKQVVSANDLFEGDVVYLTPDGTWTRMLGDAAIVENEMAASALMEVANRHTERVVGPYLVSIAQCASVVTPVHIRERLRDTGPSIFSTDRRNLR
ncbi:MAG: DUF2849 domain-containing protein [Hyphomicrobiaceae bacterium]